MQRQHIYCRKPRFVMPQFPLTGFGTTSKQPCSLLEGIVSAHEHTAGKSKFWSLPRKADMANFWYILDTLSESRQENIRSSDRNFGHNGIEWRCVESEKQITGGFYIDTKPRYRLIVRLQQRATISCGANS